MSLIKKFGEYKPISENVKYHLDNDISFTKNIFRTGSESFYDLLEEVRSLYESSRIELSNLDKELYESTDIGRFGKFEGQLVPLDIPMFDESNIESDELFSIHDKKSGDIIKVEGETVVMTQTLGWTKDKEASCLKFTGRLKGEPVSVKYDDSYGAYIFEAEYKGRKVELNKPTRSSGPKKYKVYVKNPKTGNVIKVNFGDVKGGLTSKINDKDARKAFADRHNCETKKDKTKPGYWSCNLPKYAKSLGLSGGGNFYW